MNTMTLNDMKLDLSLKAKNGLDFILAGTIIWFSIALIWTLEISSYDKSIMTFNVGGLMLPLAWILSKILKTKWKIKNNPLKSLGLWLNFAQIFYFPFLIFVLIKHPDYFVMTYVIITGAHFFPFAWLYNEKGFAIAAGIISVGALFIGLNVPANEMFIVAIFMGAILMSLAVWIWISYRLKLKNQQSYSVEFRQTTIAAA